jgi:hypothetical protein
MERKRMKIELFMENPTDSFHQTLPSGDTLASSRLGAKTAYKPTSTHSFMHSGADGTLDLPEGKQVVKLSIRKESEGALLLNRITGRVYSIGSKALRVVEKLVAGEKPGRVAVQVGVDETAVLQVVSILKSC